MEIADRVRALEERVAALEGGTTSSAGPAAAGEADTFWVLEGVRARVPDPGGVVLAGAVLLPDERRAEWQEGAGAEALLDRDWREAADVIAALGHPVRLALLQRFLAGAATVADLTGTEGLGTSGQVYHHLRQLVAAGWLRSVGGGRYEVPVARVVPLLAVVMGGER